MGILDKSFVWVPSHATDIRKTFARIRAEQEAQKKNEREAAEWRLRNVIKARGK